MPPPTNGADYSTEYNSRLPNACSMEPCLPNARRQLQAARNRVDGLGGADGGAPN